MTKATTLDDNLHWYKDAIIYELHIKAFCDSNGDGIGDFEGLLTKLDYLQELGVTAIWVLPFYPSPLKDDGYDIADYYTIHPQYGNIDQFKKFLDEAHNRGLKVITELVVNHTSDQHPWFQRARQAPKDSPERAFYVWSDDPNQYKDVRIIFQDFEASNWTWDPIAQQYYWHRFFHHQPDLNYDNPQVQQEVINVLDYWCSMGVDGFRLDAVPYLYEREGTNGENLPETHVFLKQLRKFVDEKYPGTVFLAEANMWPEDSASYFGDGDECHMNYHFPVMPRMFMSVHREDRYPITDIFEQTPEIPETCQWAMFLRNHDELTLEMVTDEERDFMYRVYAKDPKAKINLGIRHRLAPLMDGDRRKIELMNCLLFSMKGTPVIYYGDEIGMGDNFYLGDRNGVRTPMQWSPDRNAGFSSANPQSLYLPVIIDPLYNYEAVNVETQRLNTSSLFWFMKRIINMRKRHKAFGRGDMKFLHVDNPKVLAFTRSYEEETLLVIVNLSKHPQAAQLDLENYGGYVPIEMFSGNTFPQVKPNKQYFFTLGSHSFLWFQLQKTAQPSKQQIDSPPLQINNWLQFISGSAKNSLETEVLPNYLPRTEWYLGSTAALNNVSIKQYETINTGDETAHLCLLEVQSETGLPYHYQLTLALVSPEVAKAIERIHSAALLAQVQTPSGEAFICDAIYVKWYQRWLFQQIFNTQPQSSKAVIQFKIDKEVKNMYDEVEQDVRWHAGNAAYSSLTYNHRLFLKLYRRVESGVQPDVETTYYLTRETRFDGTPAYFGKIEWQAEGETTVIGMLQPMLENHGTGESYLSERVNNFLERILASSNPQRLQEMAFGNVLNTPGFYDLKPEEQNLLGSNAADFCRELGQKLAEMHKALRGGIDNNAFAPEPFSLHYQRSLFAGLLPLVRESFDTLGKNSMALPEDLQKQSHQLRAQKKALVQRLKRIYQKKLDVVKIRVHGHLTLGQVLMMGQGLCFHDFGGRMQAHFTERRLKRSPLRDVSSIIRSIYTTTFKTFLRTSHVSKNQISGLMPYAGIWATVMAHIFLKVWIEEVTDTDFIPKQREELEMMMDTYLLRGALLDLQEGFDETEKAYTAFELMNRVLGMKE